MKRQKKLLFRILFLTVILFSMGIDIHADSCFRLITIESSSDAGNGDKTLSQNIDSSDEDQINQTFISFVSQRLESELLISQTCYPLNNRVSSIWQPPKVS